MNQDNKVVKIKDIVSNQIPEFILADNPNFVEFLKQYYISQEFQGSSVDLAENLIDYKNIDAFDNTNLYSNTSLTKEVDFFDDQIFVDSVDGYPNEYGLLKIDDEIITYTGLDRNIIADTAKVSVGSTIAIIYDANITEDYIGREFKFKHYIEDLQGNQIQNPTIVDVNVSGNYVVLSSVGIASTSVVGYSTLSRYNYEVDLPKFTGCIRGFSGIDSLSQENNPEYLNFSESQASDHIIGSPVTNLTSLFLKEFFNKIKYQFLPGFEGIEFDPDINVPNFISKARTFYETKGTDEAYKILFKVLYGEDVQIIKPDDYTFKPSDDKWTICESFVCELISGDPTKLSGQTLLQDESPNGKILPASGSIYSVDRFYLKNKTHYKINIFSGYSNNLNPKGSIFGEFIETPKTYVVEDVTSGSNVITVDSTIGFDNSGTVIVGDIEVTYTDKTSNQFLNCSGITQNILEKTELYGSNYVYGYEINSNTEVKLRIIRSLSGIEFSDNLYATKNDPIKVDNLGSIDNNAFTKSLIYNLPLTVYSGILTSNLEEYSLEGISLTNGSARTLYDHKLKNGDIVDLYRTNFNQKIKTGVTVSTNNSTPKQYSINVSGISSYVGSRITAKRKLFKSTSTNYPEINNKFTANIQNSYTDENYNYITSNGFPNYSTNPYKREFSFTLNQSDYETLQGPHNFYDGELVTVQNYQIFGDYSNPVGVNTGISFYVKKVDGSNIKLTYSAQNVGLSSFISFYELVNPPVDNSVSGFVESFTLIDSKLYDNDFTSAKIFKKFPKNLSTSTSEIETLSGPIGILANGVEIENYKSYDKIYYGKINSINLLNRGENYDLTNPPRFLINNQENAEAILYPQLSGKIKEFVVIDSGFNYKDTPTVTVSGGGNDSVKTEVKMKLKAKELEFNASSSAGYVSDINDEFRFLSKHNFVTGDEIIYQTLGGSAIGIGDLPTEYLVDNSSYYVINVGAGTSFKLAYTKDDAVSNNYISIREYGAGTQRFVSPNKKLAIDTVNLIDFNTEFKYKKVFANPDDINHYDNIITINDHGFLTDDEVVYSFIGTSLSGISTETNYYVYKLDNNRFKLKQSKASTTYLNIGSSDIFSIYYFEYSPIRVNILGSLAVDNKNNIIGTAASIRAIVLGEVTEVRVSSSQTQTVYGSQSILNLQDSPKIKELVGSGANLEPFIVDGKIIKVIVKNSGSNYYNSIKLNVEGSGYGAKLEPNIVDGEITSVTIVNGGIGYGSSTNIKISPLGKNLKISANLKSWTVNDIFKFGTSNVSSGILLGKKYSLFGNIFAVYYLNSNLYTQFNIPSLSSSQNPTIHSPIIGWAYDGCPIYGPDAYTNVNGTGGLRRMTTSYRLKSTLSDNRPDTSIYPEGFFIEDYEYVEGLGTLDRYNGRFCVTPEYPNGVYAYFCAITKNRSAQFPYFIGNSYKFVPEQDNFDLKFNQDLNFADLGIIKHTLPYGVENKTNYYEYFNFNEKSKTEEILVTNTSRGRVDSVSVVNGGSGYSIGDRISFDNSNTGGSGALAEVSELSGVGINSIYSTTQSIPNVTLTYKKGSVVGVATTTHNIDDGNYIKISGISSTDFSTLEGFVQVDVPFTETKLSQNLLDQSTTGIVTSIKVRDSILNFEIDSLVTIDSETLKVIGLDLTNNLVNVLRESGATGHSLGTSVTLLQSNFSFNYPSPISLPDKNETYYFNPSQSVSLGISTAVGAGNTLSILPLGFGVSNTQFIPTGRIFLPNHKFKSGEKVLYITDQTPIVVSGSGSLSGISTLYVVKIDDNVIGLTSSKTSINTTDKLLYYTSAENNYLHKLKTDRNIVTANITTNETIVSTAQTHGLSVGDQIYLNITSGITTTYTVTYNSSTAKLRVNSQNNPLINAYENEKIIFNLSSNTLSGTRFKLYTDSNFVNEYLGNLENGIEVVRTNTSLTLSISKNTPRILYYNIESSTKNVFSDESVSKFNTIIINPSFYNNIISGITTTSNSTFTINYPGNPEIRNYTSNNSTISYNIVSSNIPGSISKVKLLSKGSGYQKLPKISSISGNGSGHNLIPLSNSIGKILNHSVINNEFVLPSDKTLRPFSNSYSSTFVYNNYKVGSLSIVDRGANYLSAPKINLYSVDNNQLISDFSANVTIKNGSIDEIELVNPSSGLLSTDDKIVFTENNNGVRILGLSTSANSNGVLVTLTLETPITGYTTSNPLPFSIGDNVFVDKVSSIGNGFNSSDYDYNFFEVVGVQTAYGSQDAAQITYQMNNYPGVLVLETTLTNNAYVVNSNILPKITANLVENIFYSGELIGDSKIITNTDNDPITNLIKIKNPNTIEVGDNISGAYSYSKGKVSKIENYKLTLKSSSSVPQVIGWKSQQGNLSSIVQKLPDNDYYQRFSYSLKSKKPISEWNSIVSDVSHVSGYKKFSDLIVESESLGISSITAESSSQVNISLQSYSSLSTINDFDLVLENVEDYNNLSSDIIKFNSKVLSDYLLSKENLVLSIDDISDLFDTDIPNNISIPVDEITDDIVVKYLFFIQSSTSFFGDFINPQFFELLLTRNGTTVNLTSYSYFENNDIGKIQASVVDNNTISVSFVPVNPFNTLSIRALREDANYEVGIVTTSYGYARNVAITTYYSSQISPTQKVIYSIPISECSSGTLFVGISSAFNNIQSSVEMSFLYNPGTLEYNVYTQNQLVGLGTVGVVDSGGNILVTYDGVPGIGVTVYANVTFLDNTLSSPNIITDTLTRLNSSMITGSYTIGAAEVISTVSGDYGVSKFGVEVTKTVGLTTQKSFIQIDSIHYIQDTYLNNINYSILGNIDDLEFNTIYDLASNSYVLTYTPASNADYSIKFFEKNILSVRT
jgi:hypothetical protein